jgi:hypothetical protein
MRLGRRPLLNAGRRASPGWSGTDRRMASSAIAVIPRNWDGTATRRSTRPRQTRAKRHPNGGRANPATASAAHRSVHPRKRHGDGTNARLPRKRPWPIPFGTPAQPPRQQPQEDHNPVHRAIGSPTWDNSCSQISYSVRRIQSHARLRPAPGRRRSRAAEDTVMQIVTMVNPRAGKTPAPSG